MENVMNGSIGAAEILRHVRQWQIPLSKGSPLKR
jgi:hypothetical protein